MNQLLIGSVCYNLSHGVLVDKIWKLTNEARVIIMSITLFSMTSQTYTFPDKQLSRSHHPSP